jgi:hypothetical protein
VIRIQVDSSNINSIGYDPDQQRLEIEFNRGAVYEYYEVPPEKYDEFVHAPSKGSFFATEIKTAHPSRRIS